MDIKKVAVIGGGQMGNGIAHVFALAGIEAVIIDLNKDLLDKSLGVIKKNMERQVKKEVIQAADMEAANMQRLQSFIVSWYASQLPRRGRSGATEQSIRDGVGKQLADDPGAEYFLAFMEGDRPVKIADLRAEIHNAFKTEQRSLCLVSLAWRDLAEWSFRTNPPQHRTAQQRCDLRRTATELSQVADEWRTEVFEDKLDPFLRRPTHYRRGFMSKAAAAGPRPHRLVPGRLAAKRGYAQHPYARHVRSFVAVQKYGEVMDLPFKVYPEAKLQLLRLGETVDVSADGCTLCAFDMLLVPKQDKPPILVFAIGTGDMNSSRSSSRGIRAGRRNTATKGHGTEQLEVSLPVATELTYADVLRLAHEQNAKLFSTLPTSSRSPLMLPELMRRREALLAKDDKRKATEVHWAMVNLYLF